MLLVALALAISPVVAGAGPVFDGPEFVSFPLTRGLWDEHVLGPERAVQFAYHNDAHEVEWHVSFLARGGSPFEAAEGVLTLPSEPAHCERLRLAVPFRPYLADDDDPEFWLLGDSGSSCRIAMHPDARCPVLTSEDEARPLVADFPREFKFGFATPRDPRRCELIREQCVTDDQARRWPRSPVPGPSLRAMKTLGYPVACSQVEPAVQACLGDSQRTNEWIERSLLCRGLVLATRTPGYPGAVELEVFGPDGAIWGHETVRLSGSPIRARVWMLTPLTVVADVPIMVWTEAKVLAYWTHLILFGIW